MSKLLFDEPPLVIQPTLAKLFGLNASIILQQLHYWLITSAHEREGKRWVYNTYKEWQKQFPFLSERTIRRTITELENARVIITGNFNKLKIDNTKWYSLNYDLLNELGARPHGQIGQAEWKSWTRQEDKLDRPLPEITTETTSDASFVDVDKANKPNPFTFYEQNIGVLAPLVTQDISQWLDGGFFDKPETIVIEAISIAVRNGVLKWKYANSILIDWSNRKLRTLQQARAHTLEFEQKRGGMKDAKRDDLGRRSASNVRRPSITGGTVGWVGKQEQHL